MTGGPHDVAESGGGVPRLVLLTDRAQLRLGRGLLGTVTECAAAGLRMVVVRELDLATERRAALVAALAAVEGLSVRVARTALPDADGVHLAARQAVPDGLVGSRWGRSCHSVAEVRRAAAGGASYAFLSPFAVSTGKPTDRPLVPPADYATRSGIPVLALAGVTPGNAARAREAGAHGVAVMSAVMRAADPAAAVARLLEEVGE